MAMAGRIAVVDGQDRFLRWEERPVIHKERLVHRSVHVLIFDSQARLVIQLRHPDKDNNPNVWDVSCAGHVEESDYTGPPDDDLDALYKGVAVRELAEELGVSAELEELARFTPIKDVHYEQIRLYCGTSDGPYVIQEEEVSEIRSVTQDELTAMIAGDDKVTTSLTYFASWISERGLWPAH